MKSGFLTPNYPHKNYGLNLHITIFSPPQFDVDKPTAHTYSRSTLNVLLFKLKEELHKTALQLF